MGNVESYQAKFVNMNKYCSRKELVRADRKSLLACTSRKDDRCTSIKDGLRLRVRAEEVFVQCMSRKDDFRMVRARVRLTMAGQIKLNGGNVRGGNHEKLNSSQFNSIEAFNTVAENSTRVARILVIQFTVIQIWKHRKFIGIDCMSFIPITATCTIKIGKCLKVHTNLFSIANRFTGTAWNASDFLQLASPHSVWCIFFARRFHAIYNLKRTQILLAN